VINAAAKPVTADLVERSVLDKSETTRELPRDPRRLRIAGSINQANEVRPPQLAVAFVGGLARRVTAYRRLHEKQLTAAKARMRRFHIVLLYIFIVLIHNPRHQKAHQLIPVSHHLRKSP
jgi:predicted nucleic acid-binding protein